MSSNFGTFFQSRLHCLNQILYFLTDDSAPLILNICSQSYKSGTVWQSASCAFTNQHLHQILPKENMPDKMDAKAAARIAKARGKNVSPEAPEQLNMECTRAKQDRMNLPSVLPWLRGTTQTGQRAAHPTIRGGGTNQKRTTATSRRTVEQGRKSVYGYGRLWRVRVFIERLLFPTESLCRRFGYRSDGSRPTFLSWPSHRHPQR